MVVSGTLRLGVNPRLGMVMFCTEVACRVGDGGSPYWPLPRDHDGVVLAEVVDRARRHTSEAHGT